MQFTSHKVQILENVFKSKNTILLSTYVYLFYLPIAIIVI